MSIDKRWRRGWDNPFPNSLEKIGLEQLDSFHEPGLSYEFNELLFVRDTETGNVYAVSDSGCSCPTPFENVGGLADMVRVSSIEIATKIMDEFKHVTIEEADKLRAKLKELGLPEKESDK